ncbi:hemolysin family protein [Demequina capsici]|uniref:Hemolysin family protein n=1 Tax=Demequina capsici TaxID=3075620 RepID=A0AA96F4Y7_9MICO|nr:MULTISPECIES: hemolysin family protein [unclassified Demequina]WNM23844.1 hemolysin family protein [Demequina sp. OYTSA14]WNM26683.1 hemolysin family protein [Demequina sp. PMTSA13]
MSAQMIATIVALLAANAFFVGAEFAVISARRSSIEPRVEEGSRAAATVLWAMENVSLMLATAQLGVTVCSVSLGVVAEPAVAHALEPVLHAVGIPDSAAHGVAVAIALLVIVGLHVVVGEMVPKNAAVSSPDRAALLLGPPLVWLGRVVRPLITALNWMANATLRLLRIEPRDEVTSAFTADEVHQIVERSSEEGTLSDAAGLLTGAIEFSDNVAADVMVPIDAVKGVPAGVTVEDFERAVTETGFSRLPVMDEGRCVGYLHMKDTLFARPGEREDPIQPWRVRDLPTVAHDDEVETVLARMRSTGAHVAAVARDGHTVGLLFLEDIIEELVGEVRDSIARGRA